MQIGNRAEKSKRAFCATFTLHLASTCLKSQIKCLVFLCFIIKGSYHRYLRISITTSGTSLQAISLQVEFTVFVFMNSLDQVQDKDKTKSNLESTHEQSYSCAKTGHKITLSCKMHLFWTVCLII